MSGRGGAQRRSVEANSMFSVSGGAEDSFHEENIRFQERFTCLIVKTELDILLVYCNWDGHWNTLIFGSI